jgi:hypothetical protein
MKLKLKEDPREWRKLTLMSAVPLAVLSSLLCWWKHAITPTAWMATLIVLVAVMIAACVQPRLFRGYYRASSRVGFWLSQSLGKIALAIFFLLVMTPLGLALRLFGKDALRLKRPRNVETYWTATKPGGPLDRMF